MSTYIKALQQSK